MMYNWEYVRIMNRNYLQVKNVSEGEASFECKMLLSEPIKGLLPCKEREVNGVSYLLYDISSMQSLASIYSGRKMTFSDFANLIYSLKNISGMLRTFLLGIEKIILYPEFIFQEIDTGEFKFVYCPSAFENDNSSTERMYQFFLSAINHEDEELIEIVYELYEDSDTVDFIKYLNGLYDRVSLIQNRDLLKPELLTNGFSKNVTDDAFGGELNVPDGNELYELEKTENADKNCSGIYKKIVLVGVTYVLAVSIAIYYLYFNYILTPYENVITWGVIALLTAALVLCVFIWLKKQPVKNENTTLGKVSPYIVACEENEEDYFSHKDYGTTEFFEPEGMQNKLFGIGKNNRRTIEINKFPFIIGKKAGAVDGVIDEASISRMHARFEVENEKIYITDLNSTNGTYKNGMLLSPNQKIEVFLEDEIWFGRLQFIYR